MSYPCRVDGTDVNDIVNIIQQLRMKNECVPAMPDQFKEKDTNEIRIRILNSGLP
jgi:hypothetical protein